MVLLASSGQPNYKITQELGIERQLDEMGSALPRPDLSMSNKQSKAFSGHFDPVNPEFDLFSSPFYLILMTLAYLRNKILKANLEVLIPYPPNQVQPGPRP